MKTWQPSTELPRDFQAEVWDRIAVREENRQAQWWNRAALWLAEGWRQPRFAVSVAGVVLVTALLAGQIQSQVASSREWDRLGTSYALSIDPYAKAQMKLRP
ncbi:hypothetical protein [Verrucomicrobium sp. GAS474]|uniref:hypothetical protein n=1 Tax=Verrucomicrobium sp. GAS474 TaxID=1882831 RepID=UPI0012FFA4BA|nr:hypothetical protein [Verrucomicrobium sp. GAS474]